MSELKIDNPAQRLLDILEAGKTLPDAWNCRKAWIELYFKYFEKYIPPADIEYLTR